MRAPSTHPPLFARHLFHRNLLDCTHRRFPLLRHIRVRAGTSTAPKRVGLLVERVGFERVRLGGEWIRLWCETDDGFGRRGDEGRFGGAAGAGAGVVVVAADAVGGDAVSVADGPASACGGDAEPDGEASFDDADVVVPAATGALNDKLRDSFSPSSRLSSLLTSAEADGATSAVSSPPTETPPAC